MMPAPSLPQNPKDGQALMVHLQAIAQEMHRMGSGHKHSLTKSTACYIFYSSNNFTHIRQISMAHTNTNIIMKFMEHTKTLCTEEFVKNMLLCFAAPTISGIKAACLINFTRKDEDMRSVWLRCSGEWLASLKVQALLLNEHCPCMNALVLIYRRELVARALGCDEACELLAEYGYPLHDVDACLECLRRKFRTGFPHEIGLFLDYPPEDVRGFIENRQAQKLSCPCCWKVYGNAEEAVCRFRKYKQAECEAARQILAGK